jgi:protein phosphatase
MEVNEFQVAPSDLFVMCSDGLTDMVNDEELADFAVRAWLSGRKSRAAH